MKIKINYRNLEYTELHKLATDAFKELYRRATEPQKKKDMSKGKMLWDVAVHKFLFRSKEAARQDTIDYVYSFFDYPLTLTVHQVATLLTAREILGDKYPKMLILRRVNFVLKKCGYEPLQLNN